MGHSGTEASPQKAAVATAQKKDEEAFEQLEKLGALRDKGILTEEEFLEKKKEILAKM